MVTTNNQPFCFPYIQFYNRHSTSEGRKFTLISFEGISSLTKIMTPLPFLFLSLQNSLANPSIEHWPLVKEKFSFVSVKIKTSMLFFNFYFYLSCSNLWFITLLFKFPKTVIRELERLYKMFSSLIKTISFVSLTPTWSRFLGSRQFPEFTICKLLLIETFSWCQKDLLKWLTKFWPNKNEPTLVRCISSWCK